MSENEQDKPVMEGSDDATNSEKLAGLTEQVKNDHGHQGPDAVSARLKERMLETNVEAEEAAITDGSDPTAVRDV